MNRFFWCLFLSLAFISNVAANNNDKYVRKQVKPSFFIPGKEFNKAEKLPPFLKWEEVIALTEPRKKTKANIPIAIEPSYTNPQDMIYSTEKYAVPVQEEYIETITQEIDSSKLLPQNPNKTFKDELEDIQYYKTIQQQYKDDIEEISETHKLPNNPILRENLLKMNSDDRMRVDDNFGKTIN